MATSCYGNMPYVWASSSFLGISKISEKSGGSCSLDQCCRSHTSSSACFVPSMRSSGSFMRILANRWGSVEWLRLICSFKASMSLSWIRSTALVSERPGRSAKKVRESECKLRRKCPGFCCYFHGVTMHGSRITLGQGKPKLNSHIYHWYSAVELE